MNPAALKANIGDLPAGGALIVNEDAFTPNNLSKVGYAANPLTDGSLSSYTVFAIPISSLNTRSLEGLEMTNKQMDLTKNFFALGLMFWLYERSMDPTLRWIADRFKAKPVIVEANSRALKAGYAFGETTEMFHTHYRVAPAHLPPGRYRNITGNEATALGFVVAGRKADRALFYGSYPITPASDILHQLSGYKNFGVKTFQAEDEIAAIGAAIGASYGGALGMTGTSGPGIALKSEALGLAVMVELPLVVVDVQRAGPSTGMPTKNEQADLLQVMFGRNSDSPVAIVAPATPADCFTMAFEAVRLALKFMTPVVYLSDAFLANGSEPWPIPSVDDLPDISVPNRTLKEGFHPVRPRPGHPRPAVGDPGHARPRAPHRRPREGGHHRQRQLRPRQPPPDAAPAPGQDRPDRRRHPGADGLRPATGRAPAPRLGLHVRLPAQRGRAHAGRRQERRPRPSPLHEPVPAQSRQRPRALQAGARPRDQPRPAVDAHPGEVPRRRPELRARPGQAVPDRRDRGGRRGGLRGELIGEGQIG